MTNTLRLPSTYVEVSDNEMEYLDGGFNWKCFVCGIAASVFTVVAIACPPVAIAAGISSALCSAGSVYFGVV